MIGRKKKSSMKVTIFPLRRAWMNDLNKEAIVLNNHCDLIYP